MNTFEIIILIFYINLCLVYPFPLQLTKIFSYIFFYYTYHFTFTSKYICSLPLCIALGRHSVLFLSSDSGRFGPMCLKEAEDAIWKRWKRGEKYNT
jgi:hypothetical protein